jgi:hypothetical protein
MNNDVPREPGKIRKDLTTNHTKAALVAGGVAPAGPAETSAKMEPASTWPATARHCFPGIRRSTEGPAIAAIEREGRQPND